MLTFKASEAGLKRIKQARILSGWAIADSRWLVAASQIIDATTNWQQTDYYAVGISSGTWGRFLGGKEPIKAPAFKAYCQILELNWQEICEPNVNKSRSDKPFYVERQPYESECFQEIVKPGALIRIKAPQEMGKTYFMQNILTYAKAKKYQTQVFSFELSDSTIFTDLTKFSRWFCAGIGQSLGLENKLADYWDDIFGCNYNTTIYFEKYLLANLSNPLVIALDRVDIVFEHPQIANDFCTLLRAWNQRANQGDDIGKVWQNLRLIIVHSTEVYGALDINHSPLGGVGLVVKLSEFSFEQVQELASKYQLSWSNLEIKQLMALVGGHPTLIARSLEQITRNNITISQLLQTAATESGFYSDYLRRHLVTLQQQPLLAKALAKVINSKQPIQLESIPAFKLESMGLIHLEGDYATPRCELYRQYFGDRL
ncbi:AAA-like domain-containing protein [Synechocystis sp. PCC 7509]|uniref:AAA-like domain-containing protein n=1 Tax=Synechocystis sp. PCC 7509 TaxID=927677 RepID=UPI0002ACC84E|nr:AAA-like domain-containing protein [Synechocystis sp. PCC 7509]